MNRLIRFWLFFCLSCCVLADTPKPLNTANLNQLSHQAGRRQAVFYWSLTCIPCRQELEELGSLNTVNLAISLVNTGDDSLSDVQKFLQKNKLSRLDNWFFADEIPERLRQAIDPNWFGELPRTYLIDEMEKKQGHSGKTPIKPLLKWLKKES